jgi:hypothetical protein
MLRLLRAVEAEPSTAAAAAVLTILDADGAAADLGARAAPGRFSESGAVGAAFVLSQNSTI